MNPFLTRRRLLGASGAALALLAARSPAEAAAAKVVSQPGLAFLPEEDLNFQVSFAFGEAAYGAGEVGEAAAAVDAIRAAGPSYQSFYDAFMALGARLGLEAEAADSAGHASTARAKHLRAASYYGQALFFVLGTATPAAEAAVYRAMQDEWAAFAAASGYEAVEIPWKNGVMLPAWYVRAPGEGRRKTVILNNGSDAQFVDLYAYGFAEALARGYNVIAFEGPGQGSLLFEKEICFTPDWGSVIAPIVDHLLSRPEVDPERIALTGWSMGGNLVIRAAASEHRLAAVVSDPGAMNLIGSYLTRGGEAIFGPDVADPNAVWKEFTGSPGFGPAEKFLFAKRSEIYLPELLADARAGRTFADVTRFIAALRSYTIPPEMAAAVTAHVLVTDYDRDDFFPGQPEAMVAALTAARSKALRRFTAAEGAEYHCAPLAPRVRNEAVFDWLDTVLAG